MSDTLEIVVSGSLPSPQIELSPAAFNARTLALEASGRIKAITSVADLDAAAVALTKLARNSVSLHQTTLRSVPW